MLRSRRRQSSAESTNEKQIEEGSGGATSPNNNNALSSPNISIASGTADDDGRDHYSLLGNGRSPFLNFRKSVSSTHHSPHIQRKGSYSSGSYGGRGGYHATAHQQPSITIRELKQFHASSLGGGGRLGSRRSSVTTTTTRVLCTCLATLLMLVIGVGCGVYLVTETVRYRDNIATLEAELGMSSSLPSSSSSSSSSSYSYSSSSSTAAVVKAGGGGGGAGKVRDHSLATIIARYLDAAYGGMDSMSGRVLTSIMSAVVNRNIGNGGGGGRGGGSRFDDTTTTDPSIDGNNHDHNGYDEGKSSPDSNSNNELVQRLQFQKDSLQTQINNYEIRLNNVQESMSALQTQATYLESTELINQQDKLTNLEQELVKAQRSIEEYKSQFLTMHHDRITAVEQKGAEPLGQGHALKQRLALQGMETVDDYLKYIDERVQSLWNKIDKLVNKMKQDSRIEAIKW